MLGEEELAPLLMPENVSDAFAFHSTDGGRTYSKLDITLPDEFLPENGRSTVYPLSAVFSGNHGVILLNVGRDWEAHWLESCDGGATWTYNRQ